MSLPKNNYCIQLVSADMQMLELKQKILELGGKFVFDDCSIFYGDSQPFANLEEFKELL